MQMFTRKVTPENIAGHWLSFYPATEKEAEEALAVCKKMGLNCEYSDELDLPTVIKRGLHICDGVYFTRTAYIRQAPLGKWRVAPENFRDDYISPGEKELAGRFNAIADRQAAIEGRLELIERHLAVIAAALAPTQVDKAILRPPGLAIAGGGA